MKSNGTTTYLNWALAIAVATTAIGAIKYYFTTREVRNLQTQVMLFQNKQAVLSNLVTDCLEYSKRNPAINSILEANTTLPKGTPAGAKPAK